MVLMTPERTLAREALIAYYNELRAKTQDYQTYNREECQGFMAEMKAIESQVGTFSILAEADKKLQEIAPFFGLYQGLKPEAIALLANGVDEILDVLIQTANAVTHYDEFRALQAQSTRKTYEAYLAVGFNESQAFACTIRTMEIFDDAMRKSMSGIKVGKS